MNAEMQPGDVDEIVLVGGSTRIPRVKEQLRYLVTLAIRELLIYAYIYIYADLLHLMNT
jgi:hypothetical protein